VARYATLTTSNKNHVLKIPRKRSGYGDIGTGPHYTLICFGKFEEITVLMAKTCNFDSNLSKDYYIDGQNTRLIVVFFEFPLGEGSKAPKLQPRAGFFGPWSFIILKNSHQDLSNEGSNFILSSLEVGH
jgi:hypothetical protein